MEEHLEEEFLSWASFVLNDNFRKALFNIIPYHPTVSLTWIFSLVFLPFIFYRVLRNINVDIETSVLGVCLYYFTVGHLSCHLMYFHQAKPMSAFFLILNVFLFQKFFTKKIKIDMKKITLLSMTMFAGTMWDELFFFTYIIIPFLVPGIFHNRHNLKKALLIYALSLAAFLICITSTLPWLIKFYHLGEFNFWKFLINGAEGELLRTNFHNIYFNACTMLLGHLSLASEVIIGIYPWYYWIPILLLWVMMLKVSYDKKIFVKVSIVTLLFVLFQSLILTHRGGILSLGSYYWGHLFSICYVLILSVGLNFKKSLLKKRNIYLKRFLMLSLCLVALRNALLLNNHIQKDQLGSFNRPHETPRPSDSHKWTG